MKRTVNRTGIIVSLFLLMITPTFLALQQDALFETNATTMKTGSEYDGHLRIMIVEIESRWKMENRHRYEYALYDYAFNDPIEIPYQETYEQTIRWEGDVSENNVMIIAAIYNENSERAYADPPLGRPFDAHYIDAAAGVKPGEIESNTKNEDFTHTVICEVGTATWCPACPSMANELIQVYESGEYPFYFIELVTDESTDADLRTNDFNLKWLPTAFYDGGDEVVVGGGNGASYHRDLIEALGQREVHDLDFTLGATWVEDETIDINISITNNEALPNNPPEKPIIRGNATGEPNEVLSFDISTTDPEDDDVYFYIDWGDNTTSDWLGPYASEESITVTHSWEEEGTFTVKVKAKDPDGAETDWTSLRVTMPKQRSMYQLFHEILNSLPFFHRIERLPN